MLEPKMVIALLADFGIGFITGVPDSLLAPLCGEISKGKITHITAANEGNALALACGYHLATGGIPAVYMQNSGIGNAVNPILSLADKRVYNIPALYIIGWRGEPGVKDEPQHITQGLLTEPILKTLDIRYGIITPETDFARFEESLSSALDYMKATKESFAFLVKKNSFMEAEGGAQSQPHPFMRRDALSAIAEALPSNAVIVSTTGKTSRELYEIRSQRNEGHNKDFLTVGSMGHCSQIALGISLFKKNVAVCCVDGEGAALMHMGAFAVNGAVGGDNFIHILINNGVHDSVGGQPNFGKNIDFCKIASACGYRNIYRVDSPDKISEILNAKRNGSMFLQVDVAPGADERLSRPKERPIENKELFTEYLSSFKE